MAVQAVSPAGSSGEAQVNLQARQSKQAKAVSAQIVEGVKETPAPETKGPRKHLATA